MPLFRVIKQITVGLLNRNMNGVVFFILSLKLDTDTDDNFKSLSKWVTLSSVKSGPNLVTNNVITFLTPRLDTTFMCR